MTTIKTDSAVDMAAGPHPADRVEHKPIQEEILAIQSDGMSL